MRARRSASPLHAARAAVGCARCAALALPALFLNQPLLLAAVACAAVLAGVAAGAGRQLLRALAFALPFALVIVLLNPFVSQNGITVIARLGDLPVVGRSDITLESLVYGAVLGLRALALILCCALYAAAIDADEVLKLFRRVSFRSALTATLATRMVPVLQRDARRMADAQRCRPGDPPSRVALLSAVAAGALDRAVDVAAALEVRGYGDARRPRRARTTWSRHDRRVGAAALAIAVLTVVVGLAGGSGFVAYPTIELDTGPLFLALAFGVAALSLSPWAGAGARLGVARA